MAPIASSLFPRDDGSQQGESIRIQWGAIITLIVLVGSIFVFFLAVILMAGCGTTIRWVRDKIRQRRARDSPCIVATAPAFAHDARDSIDVSADDIEMQPVGDIEKSMPVHR